MNSMEIAALIASVVSIIIGAFAVWLAVTFFRMSSRSVSDMRSATDRLGGTIQRLEELVRGLYSDTFTALRDTYSDMRRHIWPEAGSTQPSEMTEIEQAAQRKYDALKTNVDSQLVALVEQQAAADSKLEELRALFDRVVKESRDIQTEATDEALHRAVVSALRSHDGKATAEQIVSAVETEIPHCGLRAILKAVYQLKRKGLLQMDADDDSRIMPDTMVKL